MGEFMRVVSVFLLLALMPAVVVAIPKGVSVWGKQGVCKGACKRDGNDAPRSEIFLRVKGNEICGVVAQDNGAIGPRRSPTGYFAGTVSGTTASVDFRDSFSDPAGIPGTATLDMQKNRLRWMTTTDALGSMLWISGERLSNVKKSVLISPKEKEQCDRYLSSASAQRTLDLFGAAHGGNQK